MKRKGLISVLAVSTLGLLSVGVATLNEVSTASAQDQAVSQIAWMEDGGSVRFGSAGNGLRFTMQIRASAFDENATYGILIAPEDGYDLTEEKVFGKKAIYNWAEKDENGNWKEYVPEEGKTQIVNLVTEGFNDDTVKIDGEEVAVKEFYGSLVNLDESNFAREFRAVGYIRTGTEGNYDYTLVGDSDNVRSMAYVAQLAIEDKSDKAPTQSQKDDLQKTYLDKVADVSASYVQEYYLEQADGSYAKIDVLTEVLSEYNGATTKIGTQVSFVGKEIAGYEQVEGKGVLTGKVYANDNLVLKGYYKVVVSKQDLGLVNVTETSSISLRELAGATKKMYQVYGNGQVEVSVVSGDTLDISALKGQYKVCGINEYGSIVSSLSFDAYNANESAVWNDGTPVEAVALRAVNSAEALTETTVAVANELPENATGTQYYEVVGGAERYGFTLNGLHSKAYYEKFVGACLYLTFEYYMTAESLNESVVLQAMQTGLVGTEVWTDVNCGEWTKASVALETLLENWDEALLTVGDFYKSVDGEIGAIVGGNSAVKESHLYIGNFALEADLSNVEAIQGVNRMVEVENGEYDLENLLTESEAVQFEGFKGMGEITWTLTSPSAVITLDSSVVDFSTTTKRLYTVTASIGETVLYTAKIDFYNANEFLWNDVIAVEELRIKTGANKITISVVDNPVGATGKYYQFAFGGTSGQFIYEPAHTKEYYSLFYGQNISISLDYYLDVDDNGTNVTFCGYSGGSQRKGKTWLTETVAFDTIYDRWDKFNGTDTGWQGSLMQVNTSLTDKNVYLGNFRASLTVGDVVAETEARLLDVKDMETYVLNNLLESAGVEENVYANKTVNWTLTPVYGGESVIITDGIANFKTLEKRAYNVSASLNVYGLQAPIYTGVLDIYDSEEGVIWNVSYRKEDILAKKTPAVAGVITDPTGRTGDYYQIDIVNSTLSAVFYPSHSKKYYSQYQGENISLHLEFYFESETTYLNTPLTGDSGINRVRRTWHADSITLDHLLGKWDRIMNTPNATNWEDVILNCVNGGMTATFYVGNFHFEISVNGAVADTTERLINLNGATSYELSNLLTSANVAENLYANETVVWTLTPVNGGSSIVITNGVADFSKMQKIAYNAVASIAKFGMQAIFYTGVVDFYDVNEGVVWNTMTSASSIIVEEGATGSIVDISTISEVNVKTGTFFMSSATNTNKIVVRPEHTKGYYQAFLDAGSDYTMSYEYTFVAYYGEYACNLVVGKYLTSTGLSGRKQYSPKSWSKASIGLSTLLANWDKLAGWQFISAEGDCHYYNDGTTKYVQCTATENRLYVGNITLTKVVTEA